MAVSLPDNYLQVLSDLKDQIRHAQLKAALAVNQELVTLYWQVGHAILQQQQQQGWGAKVIQRLSTDLRQAFPGLKGFSARNLSYMRSFAAAYPDRDFVQQVVAQIPWGHNVRILDRVNSSAEREWYVRQTIQQGWSRHVLEHQLSTGLYDRQGKALNNFDRTLAAPQSELAQQLLKDPYQFDFLNLTEAAQERELERALLQSVSEFLLELGVGFALVGSQYHLEVDGEDFYIDLLFYHLQLRCYVVIDLKMSRFQPEFAGKMNFYLAAVDDLLRHPDDRPSIGIILCRSKSRTIVEYALRDVAKPIGVSSYQLTRSLPESLKEQLPSPEELAAEINSAISQPEEKKSEEKTE